MKCTVLERIYSCGPSCGSGVEVYVFNIKCIFLCNGMNTSQSKDLSCTIINMNTTLH